MNQKKVNPKDVIFSLDIGTRSIIGTVGIMKDKKFNVLAESYEEHSERSMIDGQIHDIELVSEVVVKVKKNIEKELGITLSDVNIAAAGRFLRTTTVKEEIEVDSDKEIDKDIISALEMSAVKSAEDNVNSQSKGKLYCVGYSVKNYYLNGYLISNLLAHKGEKIGAEIIVTFLPRSVVDSLYSVMNKAGLKVSNLTLEPIAAMEAAVPQNLRLLNIAMVDIGAGTSDIAISSKDSIVAYGMVPLAGDEVTETIAQTYLTDFATAEVIKKSCIEKNKITYTDVIGMENVLECDEIIKVINPVVNKIAEEVSSKIIDLNGGKAPNAVFLVGGGAHTPNLREMIAQKLNLPIQRTAVKGREAVTECVCEDNELGSIGVTVLGIALEAIKKSGHDFINVTLNDNVINLFNSRKHTVMDLVVQAGIDPKLLIGKKGKSKRFIVNGIKRVAFGELAKNSEVTINGEVCNMDSQIKDGDIVEIIYAQNGAEAEPKVIDYVKRIDTISFYLNDDIINIEPVAIINNIKVDINCIINEDDDVEIFVPNTIEMFNKHYYENRGDIEYYLGGVKLQNDYVINEADKINTKEIKNDIIEVEDSTQKLYEESIDSNLELDNEKQNENFVDLDIDDDRRKKIEQLENLEKEEQEIAATKVQNSINLIINGSPVTLKNKPKFIFIDIFDFIDFDISRPQGVLILNLNGNKAGYYDELNDGDQIEVYWKKRNY